MITEQDLQAAIAECQGQRNPNAGTCIKLAAFLIIQDHLFPEKSQLAKEKSTGQLSYSYSASPDEQVDNSISYSSDTEFSQAIYGRDQAEIWPIIDELMSVLQATNIRLYNGVIRKINA